MRVQIKNDSIKLPPGVHYPDGTIARIEIEQSPGPESSSQRDRILALLAEESEQPSLGRSMDDIVDEVRRLRDEWD